MEELKGWPFVACEEPVGPVAAEGFDPTHHANGCLWAVVKAQRNGDLAPSPGDKSRGSIGTAPLHPLDLGACSVDGMGE